jgi:phosphoribosylanthranilate isomerase
MKELRIKVCGMKYPSNIEEVAQLRPDFMGFILYKGSPRYVSFEGVGNLTKYVPSAIIKVGVLVNEPLDKSLAIADSGIFDLLQLHGNESVDYCSRLSSRIGIIKAFSVSDALPESLSEYQQFCKLFLFDNAGKKYGGTGEMFNHSILSGYSLNTGFILSGGISASDPGYYKTINYKCMSGVDLNSRFEIKPGMKNIELLKYFINKLRGNEVID